MTKFVWVLLSIRYVLFFAKFRFPSYIARPMLLKGKRKFYFGRRVRIFPAARIEVVEKHGEVIIGDNVSIGPTFNLTCANHVEIGGGTVISANVFITDMDHSYQTIGVPIMDQRNVISSVKISENCFLGVGVVILAGTKLGVQCIVGANSVVRGEFPDRCVIAGAPARVIKRYDELLKEWVKCD